MKKNVEDLVVELSALENERDEKRRTLEDLFEQMQSIRKRMDLMKDELLEIDDCIASVEQQLQETQFHGDPRDPRDHPDHRDHKNHNDAVCHTHTSNPEKPTAHPNATFLQTQLTDPLMDINDPPNPSSQFSYISTSNKHHPKTIHSFFHKKIHNHIQDIPQSSISSSASSSLLLQSNDSQTKITNTSNTHPKPHANKPDSFTENNSINNHSCNTNHSNHSNQLITLPNAESNHKNTSTHNSPIGNTLAPENHLLSVRPTAAERNSNYLQKLGSNEYAWSQQVSHYQKHIFHIQSFRDHQKEIINCTLSGDDAFVIMRTGGGKSLTYQLPALIEGHGPMKKITLVISPLLSLIHDQVEQMNQFIPNTATSFTSGMGVKQHTQRWAQIRDPNSGLCLVFVTPEKVHKSNKLRNELEKLHEQKRLGRFVIDECHCASQWGHDFRPDYTKLGVLKTHFPYIPLIAVTATAGDKVRHDCCRILRLGTNYQLFRSTANRPNLTYSIIEKEDGKDKIITQIVDFIHNKHQNHAGIIYTFSRNDADEVADKLRHHGIIAKSYHSSVSTTKKEQIHKSWMKNQTQVVVATIAFGLGINKPDVRFVLHHCISKSLESYYQESGRAGRDGESADCVLLYSAKDVSRILCMIHGENGEGSFWSMVRYAQTAGNDFVCRDMILRVLGETQTNRSTSDLEANKNQTTEERDVTTHAKTVTQLLFTLLQSKGRKATLINLVKEWRTTSKTGPEFLIRNRPGNDLNKEECERLIVSLILEDILHPKIVFTAYASTMYIIPGPKAEPFLISNTAFVKIRFPKRKIKNGTKAKAAVNPTVKLNGDENGWISTKTKSTLLKTNLNSTHSLSTSYKRKKSTISSKSKKKTKKKLHSKSKVIELLASSSSEEELEIISKNENSSHFRRLKKKSSFDEVSNSDVE